jgi:hypothetical protein
MKYFVSTLLLLTTVFSGQKAIACDGHHHSNTYTWHTIALLPMLEAMAEGKVNAEEAYHAVVNTMIADHLPVQETLEKVGLDIKKYKPFADHYFEVTGKKLPADKKVEAFIQKMLEIRSTKKYAAHCAGKLYDMYNEVYGDESLSPEMQELMIATLQVYIESAHFWDYHLNFHDLAPKHAASPVKFEVNDVEVFYRTYLGMQLLGFSGDDAHIVASMETAYQSANCKSCGMWWEM